MHQLISLGVAISCLLAVSGARYNEGGEQSNVRGEAVWGNQAVLGQDQESVDEFGEEQNRVQTENVVAPGATTYVRWGRTTCRQGAHIVYSGIMAGSFYSHSGGAANPLCLPHTPTYGAPITARTHIYGAEYETPDTPSLNNHNVPCALCVTNGRTTTFMVPAINVCPPGSTTEYSGYVMGGHYGHHRQEMLCVDKDPESLPGSASNTNGYLLYNVGIATGYGIPSPPYVRDRGLSCSVCSL